MKMVNFWEIKRRNKGKRLCNYKSKRIDKKVKETHNSFSSNTKEGMLFVIDIRHKQTETFNLYHFGVDIWVIKKI